MTNKTKRAEDGFCQIHVWPEKNSVPLYVAEGEGALAAVDTIPNEYMPDDPLDVVDELLKIGCAMRHGFLYERTPL